MKREGFDAQRAGVSADPLLTTSSKSAYHQRSGRYFVSGSFPVRSHPPADQPYMS